MEKIAGYGKQCIDKEDEQAVLEVLRSNYLTQGPAVAAMEKHLTDYVGCTAASVVCNGTAALHCAYAAAGVGPGDAVILPALTFAATANAAIYCGATPVFADVHEQDWCLDPASAEAAIALAESKGLNPKILAPVHYGGMPANMQGLAQIAAKKNMSIIEDACHAIGGQYRISNAQEESQEKGSHEKWVMVGNHPDSLAACLSFHPVKHVTTGEGGAVLSRGSGFIESVNRFRTHGITKDESSLQQKELAFEPKNGRINPWYMEMQALGYNYRISDVLCALGSSQMKKLPGFIHRRREVAEQYRRLIRESERLRLCPGDTENAKHAYHLFVVAVDFENLGMPRNDFMMQLNEKGVPTQVHYLPVCQHAYYQSNKKLWGSVDMPVTMRLYDQILSIPMYPELSDEQVSHVANTINELVYA